MKKDTFHAVERSAGDEAGVFEFDGSTSYFYRYRTGGESGPVIVDAIRITGCSPTFKRKDIEIRWDPDETIVALFIMKQLWAAFDIVLDLKWGGDYSAGGSPIVPEQITSKFS